MIRAEYTGSGKSWIAKHMKNRGHNVLFVVHSNELGQQCACDWMTINNFFDISFGDERVEKEDTSYFDVIVFDEIYFHNVGKWALIWNYSKNNLHKIILAIGDTKHLKNPEIVSNTISFEKYADHCINLIFKNNIMLHERKRLKIEEDRNKLKDVKKMIFEGVPYRDMINKYFQWTDKIELYDNNIAYTNNTCKEVSKKIRDIKGIKEKYIIGELLMCRKYIKIEKQKFNTNYKYEVIGVSDRSITLKQIYSNQICDIKRDVVRKYFIYAYCYIAHS